MFYHTGDIERAADRAGSHWFSPSTRRFFGSRTLSDTYGPGGLVFVSSEARRGCERRYTLRVVTPANPDTGERFSIDTVPNEDGSNGFQAYATARQAKAAALRRFGKLSHPATT
jgi:hypothetical protein